jgi:hypothetical protein
MRSGCHWAAKLAGSSMARNQLRTRGKRISVKPSSHTAASRGSTASIMTSVASIIAMPAMPPWNRIPCLTVHLPSWPDWMITARAMILEMAEYEGASCSWGDSLD